MEEFTPRPGWLAQDVQRAAKRAAELAPKTEDIRDRLTAQNALLREAMEVLGPFEGYANVVSKWQGRLTAYDTHGRKYALKPAHFGALSALLAKIKDAVGE